MRPCQGLCSRREDPAQVVRRDENGRDNAFVRAMVMRQLGAEDLLEEAMEALQTCGVTILFFNNGVHRSVSIGEVARAECIRTLGPCEATLSNKCGCKLK